MIAVPAFSPFVALRYLLRRPIMLIGVFGVTFAVWALLVVDGVFTGFVTEIRTDVRRSAPDLLLTDLPHDTSYEPLQLALEADDAVVTTAPRLRHHGLVQARHVGSRAGQSQLQLNTVNFESMTMDSGFAILLGVDPAREMQVSDLDGWLQRGEEVLRAHNIFQVEKSRILEEDDPESLAYLEVPDEVEFEMRRLLDMPRPERAEDHVSQWPGLIAGWRRIASLRVVDEGYPLQLVTAHFGPGANGEPEIKTRKKDMAFAGYFATSHRLFDQSTIIVPIETLRTLLGHDINDDNAIAIVTDVAIKLAPGLSPAEIRAAQTRLQAAAQAELNKATPASDAPPCAVLDWQEQNTVFLRAISQEHSMMQFVLFVVMLVAAFVIYATLHMMVTQKWKDIGILAAVGGTPRGIGAVFVFCGLVVGGLGALLGSIFGYLSVRYLNDIDAWLYETAGLSLFPRHLFDLPTIPVHLDVSWIVQVAVGAMAMALVVAILPARKAANMEPVQALSYE